MRNSARLFLAASVLLLVASVVWASVSFTPPGGKKMYVGTLSLQPTKAAGKATASLTVVCQADLTKGMLTVQANGLEPKGVYTVWLVKGSRRAGLGKAPYQMAVNAQGFGDLMADTANCKEVVTQRLEVVKHPSGKAADMKGAALIFTGDLTKLMQGKK